MDQILDKDPTELYYIERVVFGKDVNTNNNWTFELGNSGELTPSFIIVGFQARNKTDSQTHDKAIFDRLPVSNAVCKIGSENYPDDGIECDYDRDKYDQANSENANFYLLKSKLIYSIHLLIYTNSEQIIISMYLIYPNKKIILRVNLLD